MSQKLRYAASPDLLLLHAVDSYHALACQVMQDRALCRELTSIMLREVEYWFDPGTVSLSSGCVCSILLRLHCSLLAWRVLHSIVTMPQHCLAPWFTILLNLPFAFVAELAAFCQSNRSKTTLVVLLATSGAFVSVLFGLNKELYWLIGLVGSLNAAERIEGFCMGCSGYVLHHNTRPEFAALRAPESYRCKSGSLANGICSAKLLASSPIDPGQNELMTKVLCFGEPSVGIIVLADIFVGS